MAVTLSLTGKVALITGGSRGIGAACVRMFVEAGARVVFNYHKARAQAESLVNECGPHKCHAMQVDLKGTAHARDLVAAAVERFGRLDLLVVNHGIWVPDEVPIDQMSEDQWRQTLDVNLNSVFALVRHAVAQMKKQAHREHRPAPADAGALELQSSPPGDPVPIHPAAGRIVLISSTAGQRGEAYHCDYAATKGAVISMTKGLSTELAPYGIYVNCVAPGWVATDMAAPALQEPRMRQKVFRSIPLGRVARPEEIAAPTLFLCTEHAGFITGEVFNVNGGAVLVG
ncbi:MAG: SDR family NAD(P)-dependent oxidoreductase [Terriglobales bacterium]